MKTTKHTRETAEQISRFLFNRVIEICRWRIEEGEEDAQSWINAMCKKYDLIAY